MVMYKLTFPWVPYKRTSFEVQTTPERWGGRAEDPIMGPQQQSVRDQTERRERGLNGHNNRSGTKRRGERGLNGHNNRSQQRGGQQLRHGTHTEPGDGHTTAIQPQARFFRANGTSMFKVRLRCARAVVYLMAVLLLSQEAGRHHNGGVYAQFAKDTMQFTIENLNQENMLVDQILASNQPLNEFLHPASSLLGKDAVYFDYPGAAEYSLNIIVDPCRGLDPGCCMNVYGVAEYPSLLRSYMELERVLKYPIIGNESEVSINYNLIYEDWSPVAPANRRGVDDSTVFDVRCQKVGVPYSFCQGLHFAYVRSGYRPACQDYNQTLNALAGCTAPNGTYSPLCVSVAYTQTAFIPQCTDYKHDSNGNVITDSNGNPVLDPHCGTFLEIHRAHGTPYATDENFVISSVRIETRNVSGYNTAILPLTYNNIANRSLCAYTESKIKIGSLVYILPSAAVCCCPQPYKAATRIGSWQCPVGDSGTGHSAYIPKNLFQKLLMEQLNNVYPFCPNDVYSSSGRVGWTKDASGNVDYSTASTSADLMMCSNYDAADKRHFLAPCDGVTGKLDAYQNQKFGSKDLYSDGLGTGPYGGICPYYVGCAQTFDAGKCIAPDLRFTFIGKVGIVTAFDDVSVIPTAWVSFNEGRTSYLFLMSDVKIETYRSMYEIWWVVKTPTGNTIQKRKGFNITSPTCTLDSTTKKLYFPYSLLQKCTPTYSAAKACDPTGTLAVDTTGTAFAGSYPGSYIPLEEGSALD